MYGLIVASREAKSGARGNPVMTKDGDRFWVTDEPDGWVEATSAHFHSYEHPPRGLKAFPSEEAAAKFAKRWKGHPWWCVPNGAYEIVRLKATTETVITGYVVEPLQ